MGIFAAFTKFTYWMWGTPLLTIVIGAGLYITIRTRFFQITNIGKILKNPFKKSSRNSGEKSLSSFQAVCVAVGGSVGVSNISGVGTAIATGGPGALFWLWVAATFGMMLKFAEISLACYYRKDMPDGTHRGGPTYYMQRGLGEEKKWKKPFWLLLAVLFGVGIFFTFFINLTNYTIAEAIGSTFNISYLIPAAFLVLCTWAITIGGLKRVADFASYVVPFMCLLYVGLVFITLILNAENIIPSFKLIFKSAFTTQAAAGGFLGATVAKAMSTGFARSVYSNEAGWGTSAMVHATADCEHPCKQGMMGAFEVFVDTMVICTATGLVVIVTGFWNSGLSGAELTLTCLEASVGYAARVLVAISIFLFGLTTITGWFSYYLCILQHAMGDKLSPALEKKILAVYKLLMPVCPFILTVITVLVGGTPAELWVLADFSSVVPTFANVLVVFCLSGTFIKLFKDFRARYFGIGEVDPDFKIFYEQKKKS